MENVFLILIHNLRSIVMDKKKRIIISVIVTLIVAAIAFYIVLPPLNFQSTDFWG